MKRAGFSFVEALAALALLALLSASLMPLFGNLAASDRRLRANTEAWHDAQAALTGLYLDDPRLLSELDTRSRHRFEQGVHTPPGGGLPWKTLTVFPPEQGAAPALRLYLEVPRHEAGSPGPSVSGSSSPGPD